MFLTAEPLKRTNRKLNPFTSKPSASTTLTAKSQIGFCRDYKDRWGGGVSETDSRDRSQSKRAAGFGARTSCSCRALVTLGHLREVGEHPKDEVARDAGDDGRNQSLVVLQASLKRASGSEKKLHVEIVRILSSKILPMTTHPYRWTTSHAKRAPPRGSPR